MQQPQNKGADRSMPVRSHLVREQGREVGRSEPDRRRVRPCCRRAMLPCAPLVGFPRLEAQGSHGRPRGRQRSCVGRRREVGHQTTISPAWRRVAPRPGEGRWEEKAPANHTRPGRSGDSTHLWFQDEPAAGLEESVRFPEDAPDSVIATVEVDPLHHAEERHDVVTVFVVGFIGEVFPPEGDLTLSQQGRPGPRDRPNLSPAAVEVTLVTRTGAPARRTRAPVRFLRLPALVMLVPRLLRLEAPIGPSVRDDIRTGRARRLRAAVWHAVADRRLPRLRCLRRCPGRRHRRRAWNHRVRHFGSSTGDGRLSRVTPTRLPLDIVRLSPNVSDQQLPQSTEIGRRAADAGRRVSVHDGCRPRAANVPGYEGARGAFEGLGLRREKALPTQPTKPSIISNCRDTRHVSCSSTEIGAKPEWSQG